MIKKKKKICRAGPLFVPKLIWQLTQILSRLIWSLHVDHKKQIRLFQQKQIKEIWMEFGSMTRPLKQLIANKFTSTKRVALDEETFFKIDENINKKSSTC